MEQSNVLPLPLLSLALSRPNLILTPDEFIGHSAFMSAENHSGAAAVIEDNKLIGILTERDLLKRVLATGLKPNNTRVKDVMSVNPTAISVNASLNDALSMITESGFRYLPVLDKEKYIGMIDIRDLYTTVDKLLVESMERQRSLFSSMLREPYGYSGDKPFNFPLGII